MHLDELAKVTAPLTSTEKMPVLFLGHGSPMNAIEENEFVDGSARWGKKFPGQPPSSVFLPIGKPVAPMSRPWKNP